MADQCRLCTMRGDIPGCESTECSIRESWYTQTLRAQRDALKAVVRELDRSTRDEAWTGDDGDALFDAARSALELCEETPTEHGEDQSNGSE